MHNMLSYNINKIQKSEFEWYIDCYHNILTYIFLLSM
jgi:hypothetical protein